MLLRKFNQAVVVDCCLSNMIREWKYSAPQVIIRADLRLLDISFPQEFYTTIEIWQRGVPLDTFMQ